MLSKLPPIGSIYVACKRSCTAPQSGQWQALLNEKLLTYLFIDKITLSKRFIRFCRHLVFKDFHCIIPNNTAVWMYFIFFAWKLLLLHKKFIFFSWVQSARNCRTRFNAAFRWKSLPIAALGSQIYSRRDTSLPRYKAFWSHDNMGLSSSV